MKLFRALSIVQYLAHGWHSVDDSYWCSFNFTYEYTGAQQD